MLKIGLAFVGETEFHGTTVGSGDVREHGTIVEAQKRGAWSRFPVRVHLLMTVHT